MPGLISAVLQFVLTNWGLNSPRSVVNDDAHVVTSAAAGHKGWGNSAC